MNQELATFTPYAAPYWWKRAWSPKGRDAWERKALVALELGDVQGLEKLLARRERSAKWQEKPYLNAFTVPERRFHFRADILEGKRLQRLALTPQRLFQEWRAKAARDAENLDVEWDTHNRLLADWEQHLAQRTEAMQETAVRTS